MDWRELLHNKWLLGGLGVAGAAGVVVLVRRRSTGGGGGDTGSAGGGPSGYAGGPGTFDSTGTDVAGWLGNYSGNLQAQLDAYGKQLTDALGGLQQLPTSGGPGSAPQRGVKSVKVTASGWASSLDSIASHFGIPGVGGKSGGNKVWFETHNAGLRQLRGDAGKVKPGDTVYVPTVWMTKS